MHVLDCKSTALRGSLLGLFALFAASCASVSDYRVRGGDTLYAISWKYGLDYREVARWNNLKPPYVIFPGQALALSAPLQSEWTLLRKAPSAPAPIATATQDASPSNPRTQGMSRAPVPKTSTTSASVSPKPPAYRAATTTTWQWPAKGDLELRKIDQRVVGLNIKGKPGQTVFAAESGRVVYSGDGLKGYGNLVILKHDDQFLSAYAHNQKLLVRENQDVRRGQQIAEMGRNLGHEHGLYFEIRREGKPVDPRKYLPQIKR